MPIITSLNDFFSHLNGWELPVISSHDMINNSGSYVCIAMQSRKNYFIPVQDQRVISKLQ